MSSNIRNRDVKTLGYVLRRTNYGESDRILNIITPDGKISAMVKGVRKEKSKLAGSIEMFTLTEYIIHFGKSDFGIVTGARMQKYYSEIIKDLDKIELAAGIMKRINGVAEGSDNSDFFDIVDQCFKSMNTGGDMRMIEAWYLLNVRKIMGEEVNFYRDVKGEKLVQEKKYDWNMQEMAFDEGVNGEYDADDIKVLRLIVSNSLAVAQRIKLREDMVLRALRLARMVV